MILEQQTWKKCFFALVWIDAELFGRIGRQGGRFCFVVSLCFLSSCFKFLGFQFWNYKNLNPYQSPIYSAFKISFKLRLNNERIHGAVRGKICEKSTQPCAADCSCLVEITIMVVFKGLQK